MKVTISMDRPLDGCYEHTLSRTASSIGVLDIVDMYLETRPRPNLSIGLEIYPELLLLLMSCDYLNMKHVVRLLSLYTEIFRVLGPKKDADESSMLSDVIINNGSRGFALSLRILPIIGNALIF